MLKLVETIVGEKKTNIDLVLILIQAYVHCNIIDYNNILFPEMAKICLLSSIPAPGFGRFLSEGSFEKAI